MGLRGMPPDVRSLYVEGAAAQRRGRREEYAPSTRHPDFAPFAFCFNSNESSGGVADKV
jgi:hypothetical protein